MGKAAKILARERWTVVEVQRVKAEVRLEIRRLDGGAAERVAHILRRLVELENESGSEARLCAFVYVVAALMQHQRHRCLSARQAAALFELGYGILATQGIDAGESRHAALYGDLHQARSLLFRRDGELWRSVWEQQLCVTTARAAEPHELAVRELALAGRTLRLGEARSAAGRTRRALELGLRGNDLHQAHVLMVKALRLSEGVAAGRAQLEAATAVVPQACATFPELQWEAIALAAQEGDLAPMLAATRGRGTHAHPSFAMEALLWAAACQERQWQRRAIKTATLVRRPGAASRELAQLRALACALQDCYDVGIGLGVRQRQLADALMRADRLPEIEHALLGWLAAARWLSRIHAFELSALALREYEQLSRRVTDGALGDALGIAADLDLRKAG